MILFDSKLPLHDDVTIGQVHMLCTKWISESAFHCMELPSWEDGKNNVFSNDKGSTLKMSEFFSDGHTICSYRLTQTKTSREQWIVDILFYPDKTPKQVQIQLSCRRPDGKKPWNVRPPYILSLFLSSGLCGPDCGMPLSPEPLPAEDCMDWCQDVMVGNCSPLLPLVYISCGMDCETAIDPTHLAKALYGIAHVVVETSYNTAWTMKSLTDGRNPYGQYIGLYFSHPYAYQLIAPKDGVIQLGDVKTVLRQFYSDRFITQWDHLYLEQLRASNTEYSELKEICDSVSEDLQEMADLKATIAELTAKNDILQMQLNQKQFGKPFYNPGTEAEFYEGERSDLLFYALTAARKTCPDKSRKAHLIDDLLAANPRKGHCEQLIQEVEQIFHSGKNLNERTINALSRLGFIRVRDENHYKFEFHNDPRYLITLPKTGGDHRGPDNAISEIRNLIEIF